MAQVFKSAKWFVENPEVVIRHHRELWTELHLDILRRLFKTRQTLSEMTRMLGRTEYSILGQLAKQKLIWYDTSSHRYFKRHTLRGERVEYDGKSFL